jgi:hypothetical protein
MVIQGLYLSFVKTGLADSGDVVFVSPVPCPDTSAAPFPQTFAVHKQRLSNPGFKLSDIELKLSDSELKLSNPELKLSNPELKLSNPELKLSDQELKLSDQEWKPSGHGRKFRCYHTKSICFKFI